MLPKEEGACYESQIRYYFDRTKSECLPFEYSGCGGNDNNFESLSNCQSNCHSIIDHMTEKVKMEMGAMELTISEKKKICMSPAEKGTCSESLPRYYYNVNMAKCILFEYSGCEGNLNNFETIKMCESTCDILIQMSRQAAIYEENEKLEVQKNNMCMLAKERGPCNQYLKRFYFDATLGKCMSFDYGGCFGNDNNFESVDECESTCYALIDSALKAESSIINMDKKLICKYPLSIGSCNGRYKRYYFNSFNLNCEPFYYTGCDGNENNFVKYDLCMKTCADSTRNFTADAIKMTKNDSNFALMLPINCMLTEWSNWSECSANECGEIGKSSRIRKILNDGMYGGEECPNKFNETKTCYKTCKSSEKITEMNCEVSSWSAWTECIKGNTCDENYQERARSIIQEPLGGEECPELKQKRKCFLENCNKNHLKLF